MKKSKIALCFFVDALGWELAHRHEAFGSIAPHAYRQRTVLGYSCAAQPTILTGRMPSEHGHWGMFYRAERSELAPLRALRVLPPQVAYHWRFRRLLFRLHKRISGFTGYYNFYTIPFGLFGEFDLIEKRDIYAPGAFDSGVPSIFDRMRDRSIPYRRWTWATGFDQAFAEFEAALSSHDEYRFLMLYTPFIDGFLHGNIGDDAAVAGAIERVEKKIAAAVAVARREYSDVDVLIYSDHGMTRVTGSIDLAGEIDALGLRHGRDYHVFYDSTMARFWFANADARTLVLERLARVEEGHVLTDDDLRDEGVYFDDGRFGESVFLMDPGLLIVPSYMGRKVPRGMHGFTPDHEDSYAALMCSRELDPAPEHIRDSFTAMESLIG